MDFTKHSEGATTQLSSNSTGSYHSLSGSDDDDDMNELNYTHLDGNTTYPIPTREENSINTHRSLDTARNMNYSHGTLKAILFGQLLSIANACTGAASTTLANSCGINSPTAQSSFMYLTLSAFTLLLPRESNDNASGNIESAHNRHHRIPFTKIRLQASWYYYAILAFMDLEANYLTYLSYRDTSFTSITLLASLAIPSAMVFSRILIKRQYNLWHYIGVLFCFIGFIMAVGSDIRSDDQSSTDDHKNSDAGTSFPHAFRGDLLAITGAILYGLNDTLTEFSVKKFSMFEFLGLLGLFGTIFSIFQIILIERDAFSILFQRDSTSDSSSCSAFTPLLLLTWNTLALGLYYTGASYFLLQNDAALLDVSLLTTNLYAILFVIFSENYMPPHPFFYFFSVGLVVLGVIIYEKGSSLSSLEEIGEDLCDCNNHASEAYSKVIDNENECVRQDVNLTLQS